MNSRTIQLENALCDQCGLSFVASGRRSGWNTRIVDGAQLRFCCYGCSFTYTLTAERGEEGTASLFLIRLGFAAFLSMNIMILSWVIYADHWAWLGIEDSALPAIKKLLFVLSTPIVFLVGYPFFKNGIGELKTFRFSMDSLIALGSFAAYSFSTYEVFTGGSGLYFDTGTMVLVLVTAGRYLEASAKARTASALRHLLELRPHVARVVKNGRETFVPTGEISVGTQLKVLPGEKIPLDGTVAEGTTTVDESLLTGESMPVIKYVGLPVFAATINNEGMIIVRVTAAEGDTVHAQIALVLEEARRSRSPIQQLVDRISFAFVPAVIVIAAAAFLGWYATQSAESAVIRALTVLVVSCPCALGIGTPLATTIAISRAAENGVLIRSTRVLETLSSIENVLLDKTGTLTKGKLTVSRIEIFVGGDNTLSIIASLEKNTDHPIGKAIVSYAQEKRISLLPCRNVVLFPGEGIEGEVLVGEEWFAATVGNEKMLSRKGVKAMGKAEGADSSVLYAFWNGNVRASIVLSDEPRHEARETVDVLRNLGMKTIIVSGDSLPEVQKIAKLTGVEDAYGALLPTQKVDVVKDLKRKGAVLMVGDGINDAPALSAADVGAAIGSATDIAKASADITILSNELRKIPWIIQLGKRTYKTIKWNLFWAFFYNVVGIFLAVMGALDPILAACAMVLSSLFIIVSSRRLNKEKL